MNLWLQIVTNIRKYEKNSRSFYLSYCIHTTTGAKSAYPKVKIDDLMKIIDTSSVPLVVNFWASWCGPCIKEIPWFEKSVAEFSEQKVKLLLVSLDFAEDYPKGIADFAKRINILLLLYGSMKPMPMYSVRKSTSNGTVPYQLP